MEIPIATYDRGQPPAAKLVWLGAGCAFGVAAAMAGALQGIVNLFVLYVLQSSRGASVEVWLDRWEGLPAWGILVAWAAAALGAWTVLADRSRPDPRRAFLGAVVLATLTLIGAWLGGQGAWWIGAVGVAWQLVVAWGLAGRLSRFALDGARWEQAQKILLSSGGAVVGGWALASLAPIQLVDALWLEVAAVGGMAVTLVCSTLYLSGLRQLGIARQLREARVQVDAGFWRSPPRPLAALVIVVVCLALLVPADLSPIHIRDFNRWMEALTDRIGPWLVPSARVERGGDGVLDRLADAASRSLLTQVRETGSTSPSQTIAQVALFVAAAFFVWRVLRRKEKPLTPAVAAGRVPFGFRWLLAEVRRAFLNFLARLGWYVKGAPPSFHEGTVLGVDGHRRPKVRLSRIPSNVILIYLHVVDRLGERGLVRQPNETPLEYLARWKERSSSPDERGLPTLTGFFLSVRYGGSIQHGEMLRSARQAASTALRGWRREALAARLRSWTRTGGRAREDGSPKTNENRG